MVRLPLTQGKFALVDDDIFDRVKKWKWSYDSSNGYAHRKTKNKKIYLHRIINRTPEGFITDHINLDRLDNRRINLRTVDKRCNQRNHKVFETNTSGHTGVSWSKVMAMWEAYIWKDNRKINLGYAHLISEAVLIRRNGEELYWND